MNISREKIELLMANKGLTASELATLSGISRQSFSTVKLRGTCTPATAGKIAKGLCVDPADIIEKEKGD